MRRRKSAWKAVLASMLVGCCLSSELRKMGKQSKSTGSKTFSYAVPAGKKKAAAKAGFSTDDWPGVWLWLVVAAADI